MKANKVDSPHESAKNRPVIVWVFGKGGVGKTMAAQLTCLALKRLGKDVVALDADASNSSLKRQFSDAVLVEGNDAAEMVENIEHEIVEKALAQERSIVIDTGNGTDRLSREWFLSEGMDKLLFEQGMEVVAITVIDSSLDSASHAMETIDALPAARHILVKNLGHTPGSIGEKAFGPLFENEEFKRYTELVQVVELPRLADSVALDGLSARLHEIENNSCRVQLNPFVQARTKSWLSHVITKFAEALSK